MYDKTYQDPIVHPTIFMAPRMDEASQTCVFPHSILCSVMTSTKYELLRKFYR